jgi:hypothetical protein
MSGMTNQEAEPTTGVRGRKRDARRNAPAPASGAVYGLGMIGALVYFLKSATTGLDYVLAFGKAVVWPALLVYRAFKVLGG